MAYRRLCQIEAGTGPADAALGVDRIEHHKEIQIDVGDMHGANLPGFEKCI
jgi:hypothetical protein